MSNDTPQPEKNKDDKRKRSWLRFLLLSDETANTEADARFVRRRFPLKFIIDLILLAVAVLMIAVVGLVIAVSTDGGMRYFLQTLNSLTSIKMQHEGGNLVDGVHVRDVNIKTGKTSYIAIDKAHLSLGWRMIFSQEIIHLRKLHANHVRYVDTKPPSGTPFGYEPISLGVEVFAANFKVNQFSYQKAERKDVVLHNISAQHVHFVDTKLLLKDAHLSYKNYADVSGLTGSIDLSGDYPIDALLKLNIPILTKYKLGMLDMQATGSLKQLKAVAKGKYADAAVTADVLLEPVVKHMPISGSFTLAPMRLPFARSQNLQVKDTRGGISGNLNRLSVKLNTYLQGKYVPKGDYSLVGETDFKTLYIENFGAGTVSGLIQAGKGTLHFTKPTKLLLNAQVNQFDAHEFVPKSAHRFVSPEVSGKLAVNLVQKPNQLHLKVGLEQTTGDVLAATIKQTKNPALKNDILNVRGTYQSAANPALPKGDYTYSIKKDGKRVFIDQLDYAGKAGKLASSGFLSLPKTSAQPLSWRAKLTADALSLSGFVSALTLGKTKLPATKLNGNTKLAGDIDGNRYGIGMFANMGVQVNNAKTVRNVRLLGQGDAQFTLTEAGVNDISASYKGELETGGLPKGLVNVSVSGDPSRSLDLRRLVYQGAAGKLTASGYVHRQPHISWDLSGAMDGFNPAFIAKAFIGDLTGSFDTKGSWSKQRQQVRIDDLDISGTLKGKALTAKGTFDLNLDLAQKPKEKLNKAKLSKAKLASAVNKSINHFDAEGFKLIWGDNFFTANGSDNALDINLNINTLNQLVKTVQGQAKGKVQVSDLHANSSPSIIADIKAKNLRISTLSVGEGAFKANIQALGQKRSKLIASLTDLKLPKVSINALNVSGSGTQLSHKLKARAHSNDLDFFTEFSGGFTHENDFSRWQGLFQQGELLSEHVVLKQTQPAALRIDTQAQSYSLQAHCWLGMKYSGKLCLDKDLTVNQQGGLANISIQNIASSLFRPVMPAGTAWRGALQGNARLNWQKGKDPKINAVIFSDNGRIGISADDPQDDDTTLNYKRLSLILISQKDGLKVRLDAKTKHGGNGYIDVVVDPKSTEKNIKGALVLKDIRLAVLKPFFPGLRSVGGEASLAGGMRGPLKSPEFYGNFKLKDGNVNMLGLPVNLKDINLTSQIRGNQLKLNGTFDSGGGTGTLTGSANWENSPVAKLKLSGERIALRQPPTFYAQINPNIDMTIKPEQKQLSVKGEVEIVKATVRPASDNPDIVRQSEDVTVIDSTQRQDPTALKKASAWNIDAGIDFNLKKEVYFRGFGAAIPLSGKIKIVQKDKNPPEGYGKIEVIKRVPVEAFGQSLDLTRGEVRFNGLIKQPSIDSEAVKRIGGNQVGIRIEGRALSPTITVFNDAGLTEQQAMNALVTGRINNLGNATSKAGIRQDVNNALAAAGLSAGLQTTRALTNKIGRGLGLSGLTVDATGSQDDANVNITGYITPDLYLRYGVGVFTPVNKLTLRYQVSRRVYLEATSAVEKAIDIFYNWRF